ncbi:hypothetical protein VKT23_008905 [Stygiomarasmius scandens]|uniref:F-box domain-containing protein n=1 Tax=Marasmiellus scandens TaxID=2682957 RepID=A0ABR1JJ79_9AGAR
MDDLIFHRDTASDANHDTLYSAPFIEKMFIGSEHPSLPPIDLVRFRALYPSDLEVLRVQQQIQDAKDHIVQCDVEMENLCDSERISMLEERKTCVCSRMNEYRAFISPVRKIPVEIWIEVFLLCLLDSGAGLEVEYRTISAPTLELSHVCAFWRAVVVSTPELWSNLHINLAHGGLEMLTAVKLYLDRSKTCPLDLTLVAQDDTEQTDDLGRRSWQVFAFLLDDHPRWSKVHLNFLWALLDHAEVKNLLQSAKWNRCDILKSLRIGFGDDWPWERHVYSPHFCRLLEQAPRLTSLHLDAFGKALSLPFSQLHEITVSSLFSLQQVLDCFSMCPNLRKADITVEYTTLDVLESETRNTVYLSELRFLKCNFRRCLHASDIFPNLTMPAITHLELSPFAYIPMWEPALEACNSLQDVFSRSCCHLETLKLGIGFYGSGQGLVGILSTIPTLTHFEIDFLHPRGFNVAFLENLTLGEDSSTVPLLPRLLSFHIRTDVRPGAIKFLTRSYTDESDAAFPTPEAILLMVKSRRLSHLTNLRGRPKLASFGFMAYFYAKQNPIPGKWAELFTSVAEPGLRVLEKDGMALTLKIVVC